MAASDKISAEVVLQDFSDAELDVAREKTLQHLVKSGFEIVAESRRSISVSCTSEQFEALFKCSVVPQQRAKSPATDFGPLSGASMTTDKPPTVPQELKDEVESVYVQAPPTMF